MKTPVSRETAVKRKAVALAIIAWLPLVILTLIEGAALSGSTIPFLHDFASHVRFLVAIPILIMAEAPIRRRIDHIVNYVIDSGIVIARERERFTGLVEEARRIMDSWWTRGGLIVVTYLSILSAHSIPRLTIGQIWFEPTSGDTYSIAGLYYMLVSLPVFNFLVYRWVFRIFAGTRCLWKISKLDLHLTPTHPDGVGGLGVVGRSTVPFGYVLFALSCVVSGGIASRVLFAGAKLEQFGFAYGALIVLSLLFVSIPLLVFVPKLVRLKHSGLLEYGTLASHYTQEFDDKWVRKDISTSDPLLGSADIQSLADLGGGYEFIHGMRIVPIELKDFFAIVALGIIPALPLTTLVMPVSAILKSIVRLLV